MGLIFTRLEICYNLPYMAQNGRDRGDPWSLRQVGVYQRFCFEHRRSIWIFLQLSQQTRAWLIKMLDRDGASRAEEHSMVFHLVILSITSRGWNDYLEHLDALLAEYVSILVFNPQETWVLSHVIEQEGVLFKIRM